MSSPYEDILHLPHYTSPNRKRMSLHDRAAQFSPFAALTGYDAAIRETARLTDAQIDLADDGTDILNRQIRILAEHQQEHPEITAAYFIPDERKQGGAYLQITGILRAVLPQEHAIVLEDGQELYFHRIYRLDCALFQNIP